MESSNSNSKERELQLTQRLIKQRHSHCMAWFKHLEAHLRDLYLNSSSHAIDAFKPAFHSLFGEEHLTFRLKILQLQSQDVQINSVQAVDDILIISKSSWIESKNKNALGKSVNETQLQQHKSLVTGVNDQVPFVEVDNNTTPDSTNMCHRGGEIDQDAEQYQAKSPLLKAEFLKTNDMVEKEVYNELSNRFLQLEKHCISLEISMQQKEESFQSNKPCKNQDAPEFCEFFEINDLKAQLQAKTTLICNLKNQIKSVKEASNEAKVKHDIDVLKTINIELESSVAKLLTENEKLNKENENLTQTYKELYDSIKKTRIQTKDHNDSLIAQVNSKTIENADLKAQIQEKVFANVALKNELRKLKENSVDTKFAKPSILGKPVLQPPRNLKVQSLRIETNPSPFEPKSSYSKDLDRQIAYRTKASLFIDKWHLLTTLQAPLLKEKKGLVQNIPSPTPYVSPSKKDYEILFQPLFNEYFSPPPRTVSPDPEVVTTPRAIDLVCSTLSITSDQDVPSASTSPTNQEKF
ncbi:hypothetical protein Tco_1313452 [Tanacetum coccineum]